MIKITLMRNPLWKSNREVGMQENRQKIKGTENMVQCVGNKFMPPWKQFAEQTQVNFVEVQTERPLFKG